MKAIKSALLVVAALVAATASGANTYRGTLTENDFTQGSWKTTINYTITYQDDKTVKFEFTFAEVATGLVPQINLTGNYITMAGSGSTYSYTTTTTYEKDAEISGFLWLAYAGGVSRADFKYTVGSQSASDTTAPEWGSDITMGEVKSTSAELKVKATDNSGSAVLTISGDNFTTVTKTITADGTEQTVTLTGLSVATEYSLTVQLSDASGNVNTEKKTIDFTTEDSKALYLRQYITSSEWGGSGNTVFKPESMVLLTFNTDNTVTIEFTPGSDIDKALSVQCNMHKLGLVTLTKNGNSFVGTTTKAMTSLDEQQPFHMIVSTSAGDAVTAVYTVTPSGGSTSSVATVNAEAVKVIAANGTIRTAGGEAFEVYTLAGQKVYSGNTEAQLPRGAYIVRTGKTATKVML